MRKTKNSLICAALMAAFGAVWCFAGCGADTSIDNFAMAAAPSPTPAAALTATDVAKLKWIVGMWRGMDGDKPFYERYTLENETTLLVESLKNGDPERVEDPSRFELKDGRFGQMEGDRGSAAAYIKDDSIQFVPVPAGKGNSFRFERKSPDKWDAVLEWTDKEGKPQTKTYHMERWTPEKK